MSAVTVSNKDVTSALSGALRSAFARSIAAAKDLSNRVGCNVECSRNWLEGRNAPRAAELIELMAEFDEVYAAVMVLARRTPEQTAAERVQALAQIDALRRTLERMP